MQFPDNVTRLCGLKGFSFGCHPDVACYTECCRELDLVLTPYDVLCLCKELQMSSAEFVDRYVVVEQDENDIFPVLYLGMVDDGRASCPFISGNGCNVYNSRPGACRAYPVGRVPPLTGMAKNRNFMSWFVRIIAGDLQRAKTILLPSGSRTRGCWSTMQ